MSLDFHLTVLRPTDIVDVNITHNLTKMAKQAGLYDPLWCPEENGYKTAADITDALEKGLRALKSDRKRFEVFNSENGWGTYDGLVASVQEILNCCYENPDAEIRISK